MFFCSPLDRKDLISVAQLGICTFSVTDREFAQQVWYTCRTCSSKDNAGCCMACANNCHKGHKIVISPKSPSSFYCDCGAGELGGVKCKCMIDSLTKVCVTFLIHNHCKHFRIFFVLGD